MDAKATFTCVEALMPKPRLRQEAAKKSGFEGTCREYEWGQGEIKIFSLRAGDGG